ncbi:disulfide bond formation protein B [Roseospira goensis]|uniref:Disulfide bond formation protein DsbB n=1 Tax=Roseospira goensis TaxID=391922 RepID=A0A7W6WJ77_9PROT|nr:disulfide bond formation protein B [Roseospira goensis]MBB4284414.1 disulfide bond formation protein DsbB [Roseospira goensis]
MSASLATTAPGGPRTLPLLFLLAGASLLSGALIIEHVGGIPPCILCVYQRFPPAIAAALGALAAWPRLPTPWARGLTAVIGVVFLSGALLAGYHVGVEQHWWAGTEQCGGEGAPPPSLSTNLSDLRSALDAPEVVPCDAVPWSLFGISLAGYNMILSLGLATLAAWAVRQPACWRDR